MAGDQKWETCARFSQNCYDWKITENKQPLFKTGLSCIDSRSAKSSSFGSLQRFNLPTPADPPRSLNMKVNYRSSQLRQEKKSKRKSILGWVWREGCSQTSNFLKQFFPPQNILQHIITLFHLAVPDPLFPSVPRWAKKANMAPFQIATGPASVNNK